MARNAFHKGEKNISATLHEDEVRAIFEWKVLLGLDGSWIAEHFAISESQVSAIITGREWKHLNLPIRSFEQMRIDDFWRSVLKTGDDDCWIWLGKHFRDTGYGKFCWNGKGSTAHKFSYELHKGPVPKGLIVTHSCDNRRCVNPNHLFARTYKNNVEQMWQRGRQSPPPDTARKPGEGSPSHKLTNASVAEIRRRRAAGEKGKDLAVEFGIARTTVSNICNGHRWKHTYAP